MDPINNLLLTNNPDKYYEHYWLTFKTSIYNILSNHMKSQFDKYSDQMNLFQLDKKYDDIVLCMKDFFIDNIDRLIAEIYVSQKQMSMTKTNIHRFMRLCDSYQISGLEYDILVVVTNMNIDNINHINDLVISYFYKCLEYNKYGIGCMHINQMNKLKEILYMIINKCIENNIMSLVDCLSNYIDITLFYKTNIDKKRYKLIKGVKLMKLLECKDVWTLL